MTMTRAFHELQAAEIGAFYQEGRERTWTFPDKHMLWEQAKGFLRSPIKKRTWLNRQWILRHGHERITHQKIKNTVVNTVKLKQLDSLTLFKNLMEVI